MTYLQFVICLFLIVTTFIIHDVNSLCASGSNTLQNVCRDKILSKQGDIRFIVLAQIHESKHSKKCDDISIAGFQNAIAVQWIVEKLNGIGDTNQSYIPGVTIGYDIYDDCGLSSRATDGLLDLIPDGKPTDLVQCTDNCTDIPLAGVIAVTSLEATKTASELTPGFLPFISALSTSQTLYDKNNVFLTHTSPEKEINALLQLLKQLQWHYIGLVYTDDALGTALMKEYEIQSKNFQVCAAYSRQIPTKTEDESQLLDIVNDVISLFEAEKSEKAKDEKFGVVYLGGKYGAEIILNVIKDKASNAYDLEWIMSSAAGTSVDIINLLEDIYRQKNKIMFYLSYSPFNTYFSEFKSFHDKIITESDSFDYQPWLNKYKTKVSSSVYRQENIHSIVYAVIALSESIRQIHSNNCKGVPGICEKMQTELENGITRSYISPLNVRLSSSVKQLPIELQQLNTSLYTKNRRILTDNTAELNLNVFGGSGQFKVVGNYTDDTLSLSDEIQFRDSTSLCKDRCERCLFKADLSFVYIPGDFLVLGLFSVRSSSDDIDGTDTPDKYKCGDYREGTNTVVTVLSFIQAIKSLKNSSNMNFGGVAFDDCYNPLNISSLLADLFSGKQTLKDEKSGDIIDMSKIVAVVGALSSKVTLIIADQMTSLNIPLLSYGASSASLDDRIRYPFFLRTVPSDTLQVDGLIDLLVYFNFTHVGAMYYNDAYGLSGIQALQQKAPGRGICVQTPENITDGLSASDLRKRIENLRSNLIKVVIFYGIDTVAKDLLQTLAQNGDSGYTFTFIASEAWGTNPQLIKGNLGNQAKGSLVFVTDTSVHLDSQFLEYLEALSPESDTGNPWMPDFWQDIFQCSFPESYNKKYINECDRKQKLSKDQAKAMFDDQRGVHTMHAVYAIAEGVGQIIRSTCGTHKPCKKLRSKENARGLIKSIQNSVMTTTQGSQFRPFQEDGNGYMGFTIYNIKRKPDNTFDYVKVGSYNEDHKLKLSADAFTFYDELGYPTKYVDAKCLYTYPNCNSVCPKTSDESTITDITSSVTSSPTKDTSMEDNIIPIIMGVVIGILVIIVMLLVVLMLRQQKTKTLLKEHRTASIASHHMSTLNIYDEPRSNDGTLAIRGRINRSFEPSTSSGVVNSSTSSSTLPNASVPIQYSHIKGVARGELISGFSNTSTPSLSRRLSNSLHSLASGTSQTCPVDKPSPSVSSTKRESMNKCHSADDILSDSNSLIYMTAKDFDIPDEDVPERDYLQMSGITNNTANSLEQENEQVLKPIRPKQKPIRQKGVKSDNIEMMPISNSEVHFTTPNSVHRPRTLPGLKPQNVTNHQNNPVVFSNVIAHPSFQNQELYINPVSGQIQSPIMNGIFTPDNERDIAGRPYEIQQPNGQVIMLQSPNMVGNQAILPQTTQPTMVVYPYISYGNQNPQHTSPHMLINNDHIGSPNVRHFYLEEPHQQAPNQSQRISPELSPNSRKLLQNNALNLPVTHVPNKVLTSDLNYLNPNCPNAQASMPIYLQSNNQHHIRNITRQNDMGYLNPQQKTDHDLKYPINVQTSDYVNTQQDNTNKPRLSISSVPDLVMHSSVDKEEEIII